MPETLIIDTPEQVTLEFPLAGIGSRFLAVAFDLLLQALAFSVVLLLAMIAIPHHFEWWGALDKWVLAILIFVLFSLYWGYYAFFEAIWKGQTPGKRLVHIRVIKDNGRPINTFEAVVRNLMRTVDQQPLGLYGVGVITMWLNRRHRRLGDFVAGTVVVHETGEAPETGISNSLPASVAMEVSSLSVRELEVIETFLGRRLDLPPYVRHSTGQRLAQMFGGRLKIPPEERGPDEDFLERLAVQIRNTQRYRQS